MWRTRKVGPDAACTWCGRPASQVAKLIAGPNVYICDTCVEAAERTLAGEHGDNGSFARADRRSPTARCGFCARRASPERSLVTAAPGQICTDCLRICREILQ
jgi:ATP-dependent protease Clp ATPase subunit